MYWIFHNNFYKIKNRNYIFNSHVKTLNTKQDGIERAVNKFPTVKVIVQELHHYFLCIRALKILQMNKKRKDRDRCKWPSFGSWCHNKNFFLLLISFYWIINWHFVATCKWKGVVKFFTWNHKLYAFSWSLPIIIIIYSRLSINFSSQSSILYRKLFSTLRRKCQNLRKKIQTMLQGQSLQRKLAAPWTSIWT